MSFSASTPNITIPVSSGVFVTSNFSELRDNVDTDGNDLYNFGEFNVCHITFNELNLSTPVLSEEDELRMQIV